MLTNAHRSKNAHEALKPLVSSGFAQERVTGLPVCLWTAARWLRLSGFPAGCLPVGGDSYREPFCVAAGASRRQPEHHWRYCISNQETTLAVLILKGLSGLRVGSVWILGEKPQKSPKNNRTQCWQVGQKWVPRPASRMRRMGVWQRRHGWPVRRYTLCRSWKKPRSPSAPT